MRVSTVSYSIAKLSHVIQNIKNSSGFIFAEKHYRSFSILEKIAAVDILPNQKIESQKKM